MYGKYDENIRAYNNQIIMLEAELKAVEKRCDELYQQLSILRRQPKYDPAYYHSLMGQLGTCDKQKYLLSDKIFNLEREKNWLKQLWRESRPKEDPYYYTSDDDIRITINANGFINGTKL